MELSELRTDTRFLTSTSSDDFTDADLDRALNRHYDQFVTFIWKNQAYWRFDDSNKNTFAIAKTDLVDGQRDYLLPTDAREIHRVEIKDAGGEFRRLHRLYDEDLGIALSDYDDEKGTPFRFSLQGRSLLLYPPARTEDVTETEGLHIYVSRSVTLLSSSSDEPGFDREFHRVLSYGAAIDWCIAAENLTKKRELDKELQKIMESARQFYAQRDQSIPQRIRPKTENYS